MIVTPPAVEHREAIRYVAVRRRVAMSELGQGVIPGALDAVAGWLRAQGVNASGPPLVRYCTIDMGTELELELGFPIRERRGISCEGEIVMGSLPAGRYATLTFEGTQNGVAANGALLEWCAKQGLALQSYRSDDGEHFGARVEHLLTGPEDDPDPNRWRTTVAILLEG